MANGRVCRYCCIPCSSKRRICINCFNKHKKRLRRHRIDGQRQHRDPCREPTQARPGSPEKLEVLQQRAAAGQELFHPQDAR